MMEQSRKISISDFPTDVQSSFGLPEDVRIRIESDPHATFELSEGQEVSILIGKKAETQDPHDPMWTVWALRRGVKGGNFTTAIGRGLEDAIRSLGVEVGSRAIHHLVQLQEGAV